MNIELAADENLIRDGAANLQRGMEAVGGRLFLTDSRLVFLSHPLNVQTGVTEIPLRTIRSVQPCWTKLLGIIPVTPNSLAVQTDEAEHRFVVVGRANWMRVIQSAISNLGAPSDSN